MATVPRVAETDTLVDAIEAAKELESQLKDFPERLARLRVLPIKVAKFLGVSRTRSFSFPSSLARAARLEARHLVQPCKFSEISHR